VWRVGVYRRKMQARISELESAAEQAKSKAAKLDKDKSRMTMEIKDITIQLDEVSQQIESAYDEGSKRKFAGRNGGQ